MRSAIKAALWGVTLALLTLWGNLLQVSMVGAAGPPLAPPPESMIAIPAGVYTSLLQGNAGPVNVAAFYLDQYAVTNAQYLDFVTAIPRWRRSQVARLFADRAYLRHWQDDLSPAEAQAMLWQSPVTYVSWFAARAYCRWQQKRLPSTAEWEYAAMASAEAPDGRTDPTYLHRLLEWYAMPNPAVLPPIGSGDKNYWGVYDMHSVIWKWVADFQTAVVTGESRGDSDLERQLFCGAGTAGVAEQERVNYPAFMRSAYRSSLQGYYTVGNLGFRCARDIEEQGQ